MKPSIGILALIAAMLTASANAQVDEIKRKSAERNTNHQSSRTDRAGSGSGSTGVNILTSILLPSGGTDYESSESYEPDTTTFRLDASFEILLQTAVQPATYSVTTPRARLRVGMLSTDFRVNYLVEQDVDGVKSLHTYDWQVLQLNLINLPTAKFWIGGGVIKETFSGDKDYFEFTTGLQIVPDKKKIGGMFEYRWAEPRQEVNGHVSIRLVRQGAFSLHATAGFMYQRYYETIKVWGFQGGLAIRFD
jgi:hypothetical protein